MGLLMVIEDHHTECYADVYVTPHPSSYPLESEAPPLEVRVRRLSASKLVR